jgi:ribosomal protein S18 acetylase RimI-like enzyme
MALLEIAYRLTLKPLSAELAEELVALSTRVFGSGDRTDGAWRFEHMPDLSCFEARAREALVGFKLGYAVTSRRYYSWLGGVDPAWRRRGIAAELMRRQHQWLEERGYQFVETETVHDNHAMCSLNTAVGFNAVGMKFTPPAPKIIYRKRLLDS